MLTPEQIEARTQAIGSSEVAAVLGVSRHSTSWKVWAQKLSIIEPFGGNWDTARGNAMEPQTLAWYAKASGATLTKPSTIYHLETRVVLAHLDSIAERGTERWNVEAKDVKGRMARWWGDPGTDAIDPEYYPQVQVQMAVSGLPWTAVPVSIGGDEPEIYCVPRNEQLGARIVRRLAAWWDRHVIGREPPPVDASDEAKDWIEQLYGRNRGQMLEATEEIDSIADERRLIVAEVKRLRERKGQIENLFRSIIADAEGIEGAFGRATWRYSEKQQRRNLRFTYIKEE